MNNSSFAQIAFTLALLAFVLVNCLAQNTPQDYVNAHNSARSAVGVGPVVWNTTIAAYAQNYANQRAVDCSLVHSNGPYGKNIAVGYGYSGGLSGVQVVNMWVAEKSDYNYATNTCNSGKVCGHYTQVVWRNSVRLGCGRATCLNGGVFITCNYDPRGNYVGQWPY